MMPLRYFYNYMAFLEAMVMANEKALADMKK
jgi:hypothetical protein